ncbi:MAG: J domain-containing protein [Melioribacteraceae bacterium]
MNVRKIREIADNLFEQGKYDDAYVVYDEIYTRIWSAIGQVQTGLTNFSNEYLGSSFKSSYKLRSTFTLQISDNIFKKWFDIDTDQTLNELAFTTYGHLQCVSYSPFLNKTVSADSVYSEFMILHTLINDSAKDDWVNSLLKVVTPVMEDNRLKKIRPNITEKSIKSFLVENSLKLNSTDWREVNICLLDYLFNMGDNSSDLYTSVHKVVGAYFRQKTHRKKQGETKGEKKQQQGNFHYHSYERYEKYERYERFESNTSSKRDEFDSTRATDFEKAKHYGQVLGLTGKVSKTYIRKKYLELIAKYHPDKVFDLGEELKILAEVKTKQINAAYDWMKKKYSI